MTTGERYVNNSDNIRPLHGQSFCASSGVDEHLRQNHREYPNLKEIYKFRRYQRKGCKLRVPMIGIITLYYILGQVDENIVKLDVQNVNNQID